MFVKVLCLDTARADEMEVDGDARDGAPDHQEEGSNSRAGSVAACAAGLPALGAKRKCTAWSSGADGGSVSRGQVDNAVQLPKRRAEPSGEKGRPEPVSRGGREPDAGAGAGGGQSRGGRRSSIWGWASGARKVMER
ncbi:hypothetical protein C2845_PM09G18310 [Panicum miliaceum]|uniref:Uncharacterized protein n=1 Tax=Panicum miliaceum TaxID=4540 RepID=A0A3L6S2P9_PANMI|nr:hypothetical protein C2845_PM09G18310 [Panicum miliaceum]